MFHTHAWFTHLIWYYYTVQKIHIFQLVIPCLCWIFFTKSVAQMEFSVSNLQQPYLLTWEDVIHSESLFLILPFNVCVFLCNIRAYSPFVIE